MYSRSPAAGTAAPPPTRDSPRTLPSPSILTAELRNRPPRIGGHTRDGTAHCLVITVSEPSSLKAGLGAHAPRCYTYFLRMGFGPDAAADLTQETLLRALQSASRFPAGVAAGVWILGIARNVGREHTRRHRRELPDHDAATRDWAATTPDPAAVAERLDVERTLARLHPAEREVLVLRFSLDLPGEEVAALLGIGHAALRKRVARAKAHFERLWDQRGAERVP